MRLLWENSEPETNMFAKTELVNLLVSENRRGEDRSEATPEHPGGGRTPPIPHRTASPITGMTFELLLPGS